jgi:hypothetical protein
MRKNATTFTVYGDEYPNDGPHARLLATYMGSPLKFGSERWSLYRDWANSRNVSAKDMEAIMQAFDSGEANMVLGGPAQNFKDLDQIANRLQIKTGPKITRNSIRAANRSRTPRQKANPVSRRNELSDEQDYWMNVREMAKRIEDWEEDGFEDEYEALNQEVDDHLTYYWRQRQAIRWTQNLDAVDEESVFDVFSRTSDFSASNAIASIAFYAVTADVRNVMEAKAHAGN